VQQGVEAGASVSRHDDQVDLIQFGLGNNAFRWILWGQNSVGGNAFFVEALCQAV
jgi:hypothetical protein